MATNNTIAQLNSLREESSGFARALDDGRAYVSDTGAVTVSDTLDVLLENTSSDTEVVLKQNITYNSTDSATFPELLKNPDTNLPTNERAQLPLKTDSGKTAMGTLYANDSTNTMSGGGTGVDTTVPPGQNTERFNVILAPGDSIGIANLGGGLTSPTIKVSLLWYQRSV